MAPQNPKSSTSASSTPEPDVSVTDDSSESSNKTTASAERVAEPEQAPEATPSDETKRVAQYTGTSDEVRISAADWKSVGVDDQLQTVWSSENGHQVAVEDLSEAAVKYLEDRESARFTLKDVKA